VIIHDFDRIMWTPSMQPEMTKGPQTELARLSLRETFALLDALPMPPLLEPPERPEARATSWD